MERLRNFFYDIESRLLRNGRTSNNLRQELQIAQEVETCEQYQWMKVFVVVPIPLLVQLCYHILYRLQSATKLSKQVRNVSEMATLVKGGV